jgi:hypothetical protein
MTNLIVGICAALLGVVGLDDRVSSADLPLAVFVIALGVFGAIFSAKQHERFDLHQERGKEFRKAIEALLPETAISSLRGAAAKRVKGEHKVLSRMRLYCFWLGLPLIVACIGVALLAYILIAGN